MEEKESTVSGSLGNSDTDSPPAPVSSLMPPEVMNMVIERTINGVGAAGTPGSGAEMAGSGGGGCGGGAAGGVDSSGKKKRGRPRKYDADGNLRLPYQAMSSSSPTGFTLSPSSPPEFSSSKRGRGRPAGSGNWQILASFGELFASTAGGDFTPHIVTVNTGEDVAEKILSFSQKGPRGICVLSANGAVSNVTLRQPGSSGGILTYEGRFEILSLTGSYTVSDAGGMKSKTGCMSVSLAGPDGRVIGGGLAGILVAASPIQMVVGSFMPNGFKVHNKRKHYRESNLSPQGAPNMVTAAVPISQAKPDSESTCIASASPFLGQSHGQPESNITTNNRQIPNFMSSSHNIVWNGSDPSSIQRPSPDINISVTGE